MKRILLLIPVLLLLFAGCKKEKGTEGPPVDLYAENEALINTNAKGYLIADVEGLPGVTKLNWQTTGYHVGFGYGSGWCTSGSCRYLGDVGNHYTGESYSFTVQYNGMGETREELLLQKYTTFLENKAEGYGLQLILRPDATDAYYTTLSAGNKSVTWAEATLVELVPTNTTPPYYVKIHFSCQLKDDVTGNIISLKNGVARIKL